MDISVEKERVSLGIKQLTEDNTANELVNIKLGDKLYYFIYPRNDEDKEKTFLINKEQYTFIKNYLQTQ